MREQTNRHPRRSWLWLQGAAAGGVAAVAPATALMVVALLGPAIAFYACGTVAGRPVARTMALVGSTAVVLPLRTLFDHGNTMDAALDLLSDPICPLLAWVACGAGWLLCELAKIAARLALVITVQRKTQALRQEEAQLKQEWTLS